MEKINLSNVEKYYYETNGNLYYKEGDWFVVDGFDLTEIKTAIENGIEFVFVEGPAKLLAENELKLVC